MSSLILLPFEPKTCSRLLARLTGRSLWVRGFTLLEAIVVAIIAILASLAGPSFSSLLQKNRLAAASSALQVSLSLARSEAVKRGADRAVTVAASTAAGAWTNGWVVFADQTGNANSGLARTADSATITRWEIVAAPSAPVVLARPEPSTTLLITVRAN